MRTLACAAVVVAALAAVAAPVEAATTVRTAFGRRQVLPMEEVAFTVTIQGEKLSRALAVPEPDFSDFEVLEGPMRQRSSQVSIVNGAVNQSEVLTYTWVLVPKKEGTLSVAPVTVKADGASFTSGRASLLVTQGPQGSIDPPPATRPAPGGTPPPGARPRARAEASRPFESPRGRAQVLAVRSVVDDSEVWLGQEMVLTHVLDYSVDVDSFALKSPPEFPGFSNVSREVRTEGSAVRDDATGAISHYQAPLARWSLVPLAPGDKQIPAQSYVLTVPAQDAFPFGFSTRSEQVQRNTQPLTVRVHPLPEGAPASFDGAVGSFQIEAKLDAAKLTAGDGVNLTITISGRGHLADIPAPVLDLPDGLRVFDPNVEEDSGPTSDGHTEGRRTFVFPLLVTAAGTHEIPGIEWTFFEPRSARYVTRVTDPLVLEAAPGDATPAPVQGGLHSATAPLHLQGADIRHPRATLRRHARDVGASRAPGWLWVALAGGPAINAMLALGRLARSLAARDPAARRAQAAAVAARKALRHARHEASAGRAVEAADAIARGVAGLVSAKMQLGAELSPAEAARAIAAAGHPELAARVESLLVDCDYVRFASGAAPSDVGSLVERAGAVVDAIASVRSRRGEAS